MELHLFQTPDGGEVTIANGKLELSQGVEEAVYLSLFGGNEEDSGREDTEHLQWWGNLTEQDPNRRYRSETNHLLRSLPATTGNLRLLEDAAERDLAWMLETGVATSVEVQLRMPAPKRLDFFIDLEVDGRRVPQIHFQRDMGALQP